MSELAGQEVMTVERTGEALRCRADDAHPTHVVRLSAPRRGRVARRQTAGQAFLSDPLRTLEHMLPDALFGPLDLDEAIEETRRSYGARGVVDLLIAALTDHRVRHDAEIDAYLEPLKSACRQSRRYRDAIVVFERIAVLNPTRRHEMAAERALVHAHLGEPGKGLALLEAAYAAQRRLSALRRSFEFCLVAELAATVLRQPAIARDVAEMGQSARARPRRSPVPSYSGLDQVNELLADRKRPRLAIVRAAA